MMAENIRYLLILDVESTCYENGQEPKHFFSEIIEVGAVVFDVEERKIVEEYQCFVKPVLFPQLSDFCKKLTTISQDQVDQGLSLFEAVRELSHLSLKYQALFCSWGYYDRRQFHSVCSRLKVPYPFSDQHISLKHAHRDFYHLKRKMGMKAALKYHGLSLDGTHHRGIDDARNIAKIVNQMLSDGWRI
ncbi:3'-5' exonuclease [Thermoflavimicrobium dichotomicum]|uniref:Inhibitor of the KinA pathway to sporulation, predicted exonuclease n=1 Tax=Thermoflavimicrobium dichotomicum TaxID=46223 RepID=A0A1I3P7D2_9BACL|nr:3'-5' exonuclease [Thermoflavimicrobium dichotomicum]SFJ17301.1 Inhibitor of the KinA pathway to sporulation, predicted exonuclease [Thermoflavimicrobium dichotomicum]